MKKTYSKIIKYIAYTALSLVVLAGIVIGLFFFSISQRNKRLKKEASEKSKSCNSILYVTEQPEIMLFEFNDVTSEDLEFKIIRNTKVIKDTIILDTTATKNIINYINIPFDSFLKTDSILVTVHKEFHYYISDFKHGVGLHYGMFGPVATSDCELLESFTINGVKNINNLVKAKGILIDEKSNLQKIKQN
ncbi:hypothetical protein M4I21_10445 [Cellulophaga sp. 20_2_10]|uniref:hypothetical protein n=1 Tax=Cellulophaga sp. 20_2_10 TaxID=2942476 RepID=UPI00201B2A3B|nr:hypothetical protein [Cellulophaga sp. 20_2_10]MCL5246228.1 hypothetical protein [Cellulophaga sp. 20_2_10]